MLQPLIDPSFSEHSHGFRPGRSAHGAVLEAQQYVQAGHRTVVDVDLEKFFDRVNHDILMDRLSKRIGDKRVLWLIRRYLQAGILMHGVSIERHEGTPQGGPLSPLLANVLLDEVDRELERRGHRFVRYADDCNVYVRSRRAGERVLQMLRGCYATLRSKVNEAKTAVADFRGRQFLGYCLYATSSDEVKRAVSDQAMQRVRERLRQLTRRTRGRSLDQISEGLRPTCRAGRRTSAWHRRPRSCASWTNGYGTACVRCSSSSGAGARRSSGNSTNWSPAAIWLLVLRATPSAGGATAPWA